MVKNTLQPSSSLTLKILASKLERGLLNTSETKLIAGLLRRVANGEDASVVFESKKPANRPIANKTEEYVVNVSILNTPFFNPASGKLEEGLGIGEAIKKVAADAYVSEQTVRSAFYSKKGQALRDKWHYGPND
jgi:hypothetical protein